MPTLIKRYNGHRDGQGKQQLKSYCAVFRDRARLPPQREVSLGTTDLPTARARLTDMERRSALGLYDAWTDLPPWKVQHGYTCTVSEALEKFMASREIGGSTAGVATYRAVLGPFVRSLPAGLLLVHLSAKHVDRWISSRTVKPATLKGYAQRIGIFSRWCIEAKLAPDTWKPMPETAKGKKARAEKACKYFREDELAFLIKHIQQEIEARGEAAGAIDRMLGDLIVLTAWTGLRRGEVCSLRWSAVHLTASDSGSYIRVENTEDFETKSGRERTVPLVGAALEVLKRRSHAATTDFVFPGAGGEMLSGPYLSKRFRAFVRAAGFRDVDHHNFHSLRHTFGTLAVTRGVDVYRLKEIMGHARIETTLQYARLRPVTLFEEMERAFGSGRPLV